MKYLTPIAIFAVINLNVFWFHQANGEWFLEYAVAFFIFMATWFLVKFIEEAWS